MLSAVAALVLGFPVQPTRVQLKPNTDGVSLLPTLLGKGMQTPHAPLYWEYHSGGGWQAVRLGDWKGIRRNAHKTPDGPIELYNLAKDRAEALDVAASHPDVVASIAKIMKEQHSASVVARWNF